MTRGPTLRSVVPPLQSGVIVSTRCSIKGRRLAVDINQTTNMSSDNSSYNKTSGQYHSMKGTAVETVGNLTGLESWQRSGKEEHAQGEAEYNAAQAHEYVDGATDRLHGKADATWGALTGDKSKQAKGNLQHDKGATQQEMNKF
ncbi:hypothetical protein MKEN_00321300 [Mycena kentingensis (nom. inval.)]|nr:hypothetical protein MKEN_00321300 [Mycena kentingensis (nom. inval.)]